MLLFIQWNWNLIKKVDGGSELSDCILRTNTIKGYIRQFWAAEKHNSKTGDKIVNHFNDGAYRSMDDVGRTHTTTIKIGDWIIFDTDTNNFYKELKYLKR